MRPLKSNGGSPYYNIPADVKISSAVLRADLKSASDDKIVPLPGPGYRFPMAELFGYLESMTFSDRGDWPVNVYGDAVKGLINLFKNQRSDTCYQKARKALVINYGEECAYCEMMVYDSSLAVEHILPKSQFPAEMLKYANFFLSCPICNTRKSDEPGCDTANNFYRDYISLSNADPVDYIQLKQGGDEDATWPTFIDAFKGFETYLYDYTHNEELIWGVSSDKTNKYLGTNEYNQVEAEIKGKGGILVGVKIRPVDDRDPKIVKQRSNILDYTQMNESGKGEKYSDRRMVNRTRSWFQALATINRLQQFAENTNKTIYELFMGQVIETVRSAGFFSTWAFFFKQGSSQFNGYDPYSILCKLVTANDKPEYYIAGTNADGLKPF